MENKILATIGPASLNKETILRLESEGVYLFRINLSHTSISDVAEVISKLKSWSDIPISLDTEGAQIRNESMKNNEVEFDKGTLVNIHYKSIVGDSANISFTPRSVFNQLRVGDIINVDFNSVSLKVVEINSDKITSIVESAGIVGSNKAADVDSDNIVLDPITEKDRKAIEIGLQMGIKHFSLSFTNTASDVKKMRALIGDDVHLISKIESIKGVLNLDEILPLVDQILIDRGDLSREVAIEKIPFLQRRIISKARSKDTPVFVATNLLESMIKTDAPTRAEVNDIASTLLMGANGLVLAAETAIGKHPVGAVQMVNALVKQYNRWTPDSSCNDIIFN